MSKPVINNPIRIKGRRYRKGDEAALQANPDVTEEDLARWQKRGLIEGDWGVEAETSTDSADQEEVERLQGELEEQARNFDRSFEQVVRERDELAARVAELEANTSTPAGDSTPATDSTPSDTDAAFKTALVDEFGEKDAQTVLDSEYSSATAVLGADVKELNKLTNFGDAKVERLRALATRVNG